MRRTAIFAFAFLSVFLLSARPLLAADDDGSVTAEQSQVDDAEMMASDDVATSDDGPDMADDADQGSGGGKLTAGLVTCLGSACLCAPATFLMALGNSCIACPTAIIGFGIIGPAGFLIANQFTNKKTTFAALGISSLAAAGSATVFLGAATLTLFTIGAVTGKPITNGYIEPTILGGSTVIAAVIAGLTTYLLYDDSPEDSAQDDDELAAPQQSKEEAQAKPAKKPAQKPAADKPQQQTPQNVPGPDTGFYY